MAIQVGINASGDGNCTGSITDKSLFQTDVSGNFGIEWLLMIAGCGNTSETLIMYYKDLTSGNWIETSRYTVPSYYGYAYGVWNFNGWLGNREFKLETSNGNGHVYFSSQSPCVPSWVCETPLNGYEKDGCGNRRLNASCNALVQKWKCSNAATNTCIRDDVNGTFLSEALCKASSTCQPTAQTHNECINGICTKVDGQGLTTCNNVGASCLAPKPDNTLIYIGLAAAGTVALYMSMKKK